MFFLMRTFCLFFIHLQKVSSSPPPPPQSGLKVNKSDVVSLLQLLVTKSVPALPTVLLRFSTRPTVLLVRPPSSEVPSNEAAVLLPKSVLPEVMSPSSEPTVLEAIMSPPNEPTVQAIKYLEEEEEEEELVYNFSAKLCFSF